MKRTYLILIALVVCLLGCNDEGLRIRTTTVNGTDDKQIRTDSITDVTSEYFDVGLSSVGGGKYFIATEKLIEPSIDKEFELKYFNIIDVQGEDMKFKTATDFLNYMDSKGYAVSSQKKDKHVTDYTFKRN